MVYTSKERQDEVRTALRTIVSDPQFGVRALSSSRVMTNMLKDLLPDAPAETGVLVAAAEAGLAQSLQNNVAQGMDVQTAVSLSASAFQARTSFTPEACRWVAGELATALGLAPSGWADLGQADSGIGAKATAERSPIGQNWAAPGQQLPAPPTVPSPPADSPTLLPVPPRRAPLSRVRWIIGATAAAIVAAGVILAVALSHNGGSAASPTTSSPAVSSTPASATEPLARIIAPNVTPQGVQLKDCQPDSKFARKVGLQNFTASTFCLTNATHIVFWAFQFDTASHYLAALKQLLNYTGFDSLTVHGGCPPQAGSKAGRTTWYDKPKYQAKSQTLYCFEDGVYPKYIWTLPEQDVLFLSLNGQRNSSFVSVDRFWGRLTWG
jgi:hypothetical protein